MWVPCGCNVVQSMVARRQLVAPTAQKSPTRLPRSVVPSPLSPGASPPAARPGDALRCVHAKDIWCKGWDPEQPPKASRIAKKGNANTSTWNAKGTTYEEKDVTAWMKDKLK